MSNQYLQCELLQVLHLLLFELLRQPPDATLLEFMRTDEMLIDIGDDLTDYEDDVMANSFNIFRGEDAVAAVVPWGLVHQVQGFIWEGLLAAFAARQVPLTKHYCCCCWCVP